MSKLNMARKAVLAMVLGVVLSTAFAGTAGADPPHRGRGHHDNGYHNGWHDRDWWGHRPHRVYYPYSYYRPYYIYSPPPVVYYPPPPSPGISFIIPLNFD